MDGARKWVIFCGLVIVGASQVVGEYDGQGSEMLEGPRVERMHSETSDGCVGSNCLMQSSEGSVGAMWFGPRLGRRRRSEAKYSGKRIEALGEVLGSPAFNSIVTIPDGEDRRQELTFTPRVGHELGDSLFMRSLLHKLLNRIDEQLFGEAEDQGSPSISSLRSGRNRALPKLEHDYHDYVRKLQPQMP